jgi:putative transposase
MLANESKSKQLKSQSLSGNLLREKSQIDRYEFMLEHLIYFSVYRMAKVLNVSRSGFYYWINHRHKSTVKALNRQKLDDGVKAAFEQRKGRDGARRLQVELAENGHLHNIKTIARSMKRQHLISKGARKFKCTTNSNHAWSR